MFTNCTRLADEQRTVWVCGCVALDVGCLGFWPSVVGGGQLVSGFAWRLCALLQMLQKWTKSAYAEDGRGGAGGGFDAPSSLGHLIINFGPCSPRRRRILWLAYFVNSLVLLKYVDWIFREQLHLIRNKESVLGQYAGLKWSRDQNRRAPKCDAYRLGRHFIRGQRSNSPLP